MPILAQLQLSPLYLSKFCVILSRRKVLSLSANLEQTESMTNQKFFFFLLEQDHHHYH